MPVGIRTEDGHRLHLKYITISFPAYLTERTSVIHSWHHDVQRFIGDLNLQWRLNPHLPIEGRIPWIRARGKGHSSCLEMMDAGDTRQLRRVARRIGCVCPGGPYQDVALWVKEIS